ncbi:hypothetical protein [Paenibacillus sp. Y412MC10]|uniref:hypothetical protein n=1 Tax=Geobacillus sp. (strain Y412MC10) TaxID=481743 RepID=UPI0021B2C6BA|nr:hypothetical protein [Paenibacillus sp. Y412MC10]
MLWSGRADAAQEALRRHYWNPDIAMFNIETPCPNGECNTIFHYGVDGACRRRAGRRTAPHRRGSVRGDARGAA